MDLPVDKSLGAHHSEGIIGDGRGVAVGGDYSKAGDATSTGAISQDAGKSWSAISLPGYRSAVAYSPSLGFWIAAGISGSEVSSDGKDWRPIGSTAIHALSFSGSAGWAVGPAGFIGAFRSK